MRVSLAATAGFCMGVRRAMELALTSLSQNEKPIYTYGPLIHNPQVLQLLQKRGIAILEEIPAPGTIRGGTVIIRAHGVPPQIKTRLQGAGFSNIIDGTCSRVIRVQQIIARAVRRGATVIIVGDAAHPEVVGLLAHAQTWPGQGPRLAVRKPRLRAVSFFGFGQRKILPPGKAKPLKPARRRGYVLNSPEEVKQLPSSLRRLVAVAQTTQHQEVFQQVCERLRERFGSIRVHQTICAATRQRQDEVIALARKVDAVVVVGGKQSANSLRLAQLAEKNATPAFLVEDGSDLPARQLAGLDSIGVTAGASTPNWMIKRILSQLQDLPGPTPSPPWLRACRNLAAFLWRGQIALGLAAAGLTLAAMRIQGISLSWLNPLTAFCFVLAVHLSNRLWRSQADQYNDPEQSIFLQQYHAGLWFLVAAAALCALLLAFFLGCLPFLGLLLLLGLGFLYSWPRGGIMARLRSLPGSKSISAVLAWGVVCALLPPLNAQAACCPNLILTAAACFYVAILIFIRNSLTDLLSIQGDLFVGQETIPIILGSRYTRFLLDILSLLLSLLLALAPLCLSGWPWELSLALFAPLAGLNLWQRWIARRTVFLTIGQWLLLEMSLWLSVCALLAPGTI
jgi:4-hydroxy-3-methylbut-2-enyl diphosphate reductase